MAVLFLVCWFLQDPKTSNVIYVIEYTIWCKTSFVKQEPHGRPFSSSNNEERSNLINLCLSVFSCGYCVSNLREREVVSYIKHSIESYVFWLDLSSGHCLVMIVFCFPFNYDCYLDLGTSQILSATVESFPFRPYNQSSDKTIAVVLTPRTFTELHISWELQYCVGN